MASEGLNKVLLIGNLGMDPELKHGQTGTAVMRLRLATTERYLSKAGERQERTEWHTVVFFGNRAEGLSRHLTKGQTVYVEGRIQTREWEDRDGNRRYTTEVVGNELLFLDSGRAAGGGGGYGGGKPASTPAGGDNFGDDDIPFAVVDERAH